MTKLKFTKHTKEVVETDIDLPAYFFHQDNDCLIESYLKYDGSHLTEVRSGLGEFTIQKTSCKDIPEDWKHILSNRKDFEQAFEETLMIIKGTRD